MKHRMDKNVVQKRFGRSAKEYDQYAVVQKKMGNRLLEKVVEQGGSPRQILEIGCGTGYLTERLVRLFPESSITAIDISQEMLDMARGKLNDPKNVNWVHSDAERYVFNSSDQWDLIVSNAAVQWFHDPFGTIKRYIERLSTGGTLSFSSFGPRTFHELHYSFAQAERRLQNQVKAVHGQTFPSKENWGRALSGAAGRLRVDEEEWVEYHPDVRSFLKSVQKIGASNASSSSQKVYTPKSVMLAMMEEYDKQYRVQKEKDSYIPVTYHCLYGYYVEK
jgi:malonyl-CoA O-methyltransferase